MRASNAGAPPSESDKPISCCTGSDGASSRHHGGWEAIRESEGTVYLKVHQRRQRRAGKHLPGHLWRGELMSKI
jgi:hypothetical protein